MTGWAVAARFLNIGEAEIAASALDAAGIDCDLLDEAIVRVDWFMAQAVGGIKLVVRAEDLAAARDVLTSPPASHPHFEDVGAPRSPRRSTAETAVLPQEVPAACPECGSHAFAPIPRLRIFLLLAAAFLGIGLVAGEPLLAITAFVAVAVAVLLLPSTRCTACGYRFTPPPSMIDQGPDAKDRVEDSCPRCGSKEVHAIDHRRLKAIPLLINPAIVVAAPLWLLSPKRICDACGLKFR